MLVTPLQFPDKLPNLLRKCVAPIFDHFDAATLGDLRAATWRDDHGRVAPVRVTVSRLRNRSIRSLEARLVDPSKFDQDHFLEQETEASHFFAAVQVVGCMRDAANSIVPSLVRYLVDREVEARYADGPRELVKVPVETLDDFVASNRYTSFFSPGRTPAVYAAEELLKGLVRAERDLRKSESAHAHIEARGKFAKANEAAAKALSEELSRVRTLDDVWCRASRHEMHNQMTDEEYKVLCHRQKSYERMMEPLGLV